MDLYRILNVDIDADKHTIRNAYKKLVLKYHPDRSNSKKKFIQLKNAYEILYNEKTRTKYDRKYKYKQIDLNSFIYYLIDLCYSIPIYYNGANKFFKSNIFINLEVDLKDIYIDNYGKLNDQGCDFIFPYREKEMILPKNNNSAIFLKIYSKPHKFFKKLNDIDLFVIKDISYENYCKKYCFKLKHIDGEILTISTESFQNCTVLKNKGLPYSISNRFYSVNKISDNIKDIARGKLYIFLRLIAE